MGSKSIFRILIAYLSLPLLASCSLFPAFQSFPTVTALPTLTPAPSTTPTTTPPPSPTPIKAVRAGTAFPFEPVVITAENSDQVVEMARLGEGIPQFLAWSPGGSVLAIATSQGVTMLSGPTAADLWRTGQAGGQNTLTFNPDGSTLAAGGMNGRITLLKTEDGTILKTLNAHSQSIQALAFSHEGRALASSARDGTIKLWSLQDSSMARQFPSPGRSAQALAFSEDDKVLYAWSPDEQVNTWSLEDGNRLDDLYIGTDGQGNSATHASFSGDGRLLASAQGLKVRLTWTENGTTLAMLQPMPENVLRLALSDDGALAVVLMETRAQIWETSKPRMVAEIPRPGPMGTPTNLSISSDHNEIALLGQELEIWRPSGDAETVRHYPAWFSPGSATGLQFEPDGNQAALELLDGRIVKVHMDGHEASLQAAPFPAGDAMASPLGGRLAAAAYPNFRLQVWDNDNQKQLFEFTNLPGRVSHLVFSPDGNLLTGSIGEDGIRIWSMTDGTLAADLQTDHPTLQLEFSADGKWLAAGTLGSVVRWSTLDWAVGGAYPGSAFAFAPDHNVLAVYGWEQGKPVTTFWNLADNKQLLQFEGGGSRMAFSPDGRLLVCSGRELSLRSVSTGETITSWNNPSPYSIPAFTPNGKMLLLAGWDGTLYVFGIPGG